MKIKIVAMIQHVMRTFTLHQLNQLRTSNASVSLDGTRPLAGPIWSTGHVQVIDRTIDAYFECTVRHNTADILRSHRKLLIVQFLHPGLDAVGLGRRLNEPTIMATHAHDELAYAQHMHSMKCLSMSDVALLHAQTCPCCCTACN